MGRRVPKPPLYHTSANLSSNFSKKVAQIFIPNFVQFDYCNSLLCVIYLYYRKRDREPKVKAVEKISKKNLKKVLTNKTAYDIIDI